MSDAQLATRIDSKIKNALDRVCKARGVKMNRFIEEAVLDKLEEMEDSEDLQALRRETFRPLSGIIQDLKAHGKL